MKREYKKWKSPSLGKEMEMLVFGDRGTPIIIFPSDEERFYEWEDAGLIESLSEQINEGYNQIFCVDSVAYEGFLNKDVEPFVRISRQKQYEDYIIDEVIPFIRKENKSKFIVATGANLGAYYALLFALKHPQHIQKVIGISGTYDIKPYLDGFYDDNVYFNSPNDFLPNMHEKKTLKEISKVDIRLLTYSNDPQRLHSEEMSDTLWLKNLDHNFYVWEKKVSEPWNIVAPMLKQHLF